jgi:hypothetical protein
MQSQKAIGTPVIGFIIHTTSDSDLILFSHFFDDKSTTHKDIHQRNFKDDSYTVIQRVIKDWDRLSAIQEDFDTVQQGTFMIHDAIAQREGSWLILYQPIPRSELMLTLICNVRNCNRVLASHVLSLITLQIVTQVTTNPNADDVNAPMPSSEKQILNAKEFLLRPEQIYACLHRYCPHGQLIIA